MLPVTKTLPQHAGICDKFAMWQLFMLAQCSTDKSSPFCPQLDVSLHWTLLQAFLFYGAGNIQRVTRVHIINSSFTANNATNIEASVPGGIFDVGECAGAHISSCSCVGILNSTFEDNTGTGLCLRDISGTCEVGKGQSSAFPPLFNRFTIASSQNTPMIDQFLSNDASISVALDIRRSTFRHNTAASLTRQYDEPTQPQDPLAGGAAIDILAVPFSIIASNTFEANRGRQGSAVHLDSCTATVIWDGTFNGNTATHEGGAIASVNSHGRGVLLGESNITSSSALSGGSIYADSGASVIITSGCQLSNNVATTTGGAVNCVGCQNMTVQLGSVASSNQAQQSGGACYCDGCTVFHLSDIELENNRCISPENYQTPCLGLP